jgi:hypothetical protein
MGNVISLLGNILNPYFFKEFGKILKLPDSDEQSVNA